MWYPNKAQWWVIWITAILLILLIMVDASGETEPSHLGASILIIGSLLVWQLSKRR